MKRFVVVAGLPASGKSMLGQAVARSLGLSVIDKDTHLERLFEFQAFGSAMTREMLSREADRSFRKEAECAQGAVLVSWWRHPSSISTSGTPIKWLSALAGSLVELQCICRPPVAVERFIARSRHSGHGDSQRSVTDLLVQFEQQAILGALGVGALIEVNTEASINLEGLVTQITAAFSSAGGLASAA